ncbi:MAG: Hsp70 family protein [Deltaproteobacteria bacterium]|nr:Hsp70 family protein [Deltaproteobacteria bacterium]
MARVIGIDLGTTNTLAAWADGRVPRIVPTERGHNHVPSVVAVTGGRIVVGHPAREQLLIHPASTITGSKRLLGRPFSSPVVQRLKRKLAWEVVEGAHGTAAARIPHDDGGGADIHELTDVSAVLLKTIARYAEAHLGGPIDGAVVSVPAYYPLTQREAVRTAAKAAGLDVWRLVNEPTAAALAYGIGRNINQKLLVFDLGGGTFDVSVLEVQGGTFQVLATGGDGALGGVDFDIRLCDHLLDRFEQENGVSVRDDATVVQRVLFAAETAKQDLSLLQHTEVRLPFVKQTVRGKPLDLVMHVSRLQLVKLTEDLIERASAAVDDVLASAGLSHSEIDEVLVAGGQTRMPAIQARLEKQFGRPPRRGVNPDEVVAQGAALLARSLSGNAVQLYDVLSLPVGIVAVDKSGIPRVQTVLAKNAQLPVEAAVDVVVGPSRRVDLYQVPNARETDPALCEPLGGVLLTDKQPGDRCTLTLRIDADTRLEIKEGSRILELRAGRGEEAPRRQWPKTDPQMTTATTSTSLLGRLFRR